MSIAFRLLGVPVRVHLWFWLMAFAIGPQTGKPGWLFTWIAVVFTGILLHEFGHAWMGRRFGREPNIELVALGGITWWRQAAPLSPGRSIAVSLAGPAVGIVLGTIAWLVRFDLAPAEGTFASYLLTSVIWVNLYWGLLNLIPVLPLDGGNIAASALEMAFPQKGRIAACYLSFLLVGVLVPIVGVYFQNPLMVMFLLFFGFSTFQIFRAERARASGAGESPGLSPAADSLAAQCFAALERGDGADLVELASEMVRRAKTAVERDESFHLLAWGKLLHGDAQQAQDALRSISTDRSPDPALEGAVFVELGQTDEALPILEAAREHGGGAFVESYLLRAIRAEEAWDHIVEKARALTRRGKTQDALRWLVLARDAGLREIAALETDTDFADVRALPEWSEFATSLDTTP